MKKLFLATALLTLTTASFAATTGTLVLQGTVAKAASITVSAAASAAILDLASNQTDLVVGSVTEKSNSKDGYTVTILSTNAGKLKNTATADTLAYNLKYAGTAVTLGASATSIDNVYVSTAAAVKSVQISYSALNAELVAGTYADTLTFSIVAK